MGGTPPIYSSVQGPAKWAAVVVLSISSGAGLTYSLLNRVPRDPDPPRRATVEHPPRAQAPAPQPAPPPAPQPAALSQVQVPADPPMQDQPAPQPLAEAAPQPAPTPPPAKSPPAPLTRTININKASAAELELLPHIGPALAQRIIDYRATHGQFRSITDLDKVKGIGPKTLAKLAPLITVD